MTHEKQRIALAEWAGWRYSPDADSSIKHEATMAWYRPGNSPWQLEQLPDYLNDLNAVHKLEEKLRENSHAWAKYGEQLQEIVNHYPVGVVPDYHRDLRSLASVAHATAAKRCEALLKTLNLWKGGEA